MHKCCATCGYLGIRERFTREICEAELPLRESGTLPREPDRIETEGKRWDGKPLCLMHVEQFGEVEETPTGRRIIAVSANADGGPAKLLAILQNPRDECDHYTEWNPGFTPKEHAEMNFHRAIIESQLSRDEADRKWRAEQAEMEHKWRRRQAQRERTWRREDARDAKVTLRWSVGVGIGAALIGALATLLAVWLTKWLGDPAERPPQPIVVEYRPIPAAESASMPAVRATEPN